MRTIEFVPNSDYGNATANPEDAITAVERKGTNGYVVMFVGSENNPGCLPAIRWRSAAMWTYVNGVWYRTSIHGGDAEQLHEERPHL